MQQKRLLLFVALMIAFFGIWYAGKVWIFPQRPPEEEPPKPVKDGALHLALGPWNMDQVREVARASARPVKDPALHLALGPWDMGLVRDEAARLAAKAERSRPSTRVTLGSKEGGSKFHLYVELDSKGACVRSVWLNKFQATDENGKPAGRQLELVPGAANAHAARSCSTTLLVRTPRSTSRRRGRWPRSAWRPGTRTRRPRRGSTTTQSGSATRRNCPTAVRSRLSPSLTG
jgi:hypothetical protein